MSLKLYGKTENGTIESGWFEPDDSRKKRKNGWVTDPALLESPKEEELEIVDNPNDSVVEEPDCIYDPDKEPEDEVVKPLSECSLQELKDKAKEINYPYYRKAKEKRLIEILEKHYDNQD